MRHRADRHAGRPSSAEGSCGWAHPPPRSRAGGTRGSARGGPRPTGTRSALLEVAATIPTVTVEYDVKDYAGRPAVAVTATDESGDSKLFFDPSSAQLLGTSVDYPAADGRPAFSGVACLPRFRHRLPDRLASLVACMFDLLRAPSRGPSGRAALASARDGTRGRARRASFGTLLPDPETPPW